MNETTTSNFIPLDSIPTLDDMPEVLMPQIGSLNDVKEEEARAVEVDLPWETSYVFRFETEVQEKFGTELQKILKIYPIEIPPHPSFQEIVQLCLWGMWRLTGKHRTDFMPSDATSMIDFDNPPETKCNLFNNSFIFLFQVACKLFDRMDLTKKFRMLMISASFSEDLARKTGTYEDQNHAYIGVVWNSPEGLKTFALDPYHTRSVKDRTPEEILAKSDFTVHREFDLLIALIEFSGAKSYGNSQHVAKIISLLLQRKDLVKEEIISALLNRIAATSHYKDFENEMIQAMENSMKTMDYDNPLREETVKDYRMKIATLKARQAMMNNQIAFLKKL